jgi:hypothetical protein
MPLYDRAKILGFLHRVDQAKGKKQRAAKGKAFEELAQTQRGSDLDRIRVLDQLVGRPLELERALTGQGKPAHARARRPDTPTRFRA